MTGQTSPGREVGHRWGEGQGLEAGRVSLIRNPEGPGHSGRGRGPHPTRVSCEDGSCPWVGLTPPGGEGPHSGRGWGGDRGHVCPQNDEAAMVEAVALYNPVSFAFEVTEDFMLYRKGIYSRWGAAHSGGRRRGGRPRPGRDWRPQLPPQRGPSYENPGWRV